MNEKLINNLLRGENKDKEEWIMRNRLKIKKC